MNTEFWGYTALVVAILNIISFNVKIYFHIKYLNALSHRTNSFSIFSKIGVIFPFGIIKPRKGLEKLANTVNISAKIYLLTFLIVLIYIIFKPR